MIARRLLWLALAMISAAALVGYTRPELQVLWLSGSLLCR